MSAIRYMCILLYAKLIWCSGFVYIYGVNWRREWRYVCHGYICILLYVKLIWCSGVAYIYGQLGGSEGTSGLGICAFFYM